MLAVAVLGIILELRATELSRALFSWRGCGQRAHYFARVWAARTLFRAKVGCALVFTRGTTGAEMLSAVLFFAQFISAGKTTCGRERAHFSSAGSGTRIRR